RVVADADGGRRGHSIAVTMRTPGHDFELAAGFLISESVIASAAELWRLDRCRDAGEDSAENIVEAHLAPGVDFDPQKFSRHVFTSSSCGICGKATIERLLEVRPNVPRGDFTLDARLIRELPARMLESQTVFARTGGLHAAALVQACGDLGLLREDVGRHNAVDKLVGASVLAGNLPLDDSALLVSGRASFELVQKALMAGIAVLLAVGAPSSLAVATAREFGMTLVGFLKSGGFNIYSGRQRLLCD
ncbi:MAG: formate dehydrogenase accessory sulfurtransferase FdhD, partial [Acidobacteriota bacterium]|nr:formate dehydrogenase accessory sulfurtransferase FdhD [Acidobacteriota bacterium]